ncbi:MAG TPA: zinc-binding alcohol dehydrogenase family protein [Lacisediminihabitans sp.]|uniref:zinc-binding alcohol dehydrogenase family protein n=1 Tax=Lacisediminihabitans sp. TaxID=2787631 RepID=UPI002EDADCBB
MGTMHAIGYTTNLPATDRDALVDLELPVPSPARHDLLVAVFAVSVNPADVKLRAGSAPGGEARILGFDAAGVVRAVGDGVTLFAPGDEVYYAGSVDRPGSDAEFQLVDERLVGRKPATLSFEDAAAMPLTTITAWEVLFERLRLTDNSGGTMLVIGASGGVGSMILQLAKRLVPGLRLIATASRPEAEEWVRRLGADAVVNHRGDLVAQVLETAPHGVDYLFTSHSEGQIETYAAIVKPFGHIVGIDDPEVLDVTPLKDKSIAWHWEFMFTRPVQQTPDMVDQHELLDQVAFLVDAGRIVSTATTRLSPLDAERLREAHRLVESGSVIGKVVVSRQP